jgi:hypothetical protein
VGDGSGPFSVDGTTTSREAPPSALVRGRATEVDATGYTVPASSVPAATAPAKATDVAPRPGG